MDDRISYNETKSRPGRLESPFHGHVTEAMRKLGGLSQAAVEPKLEIPDQSAIEASQRQRAAQKLAGLVSVRG